jgi:hypothetical protein
MNKNGPRKRVETLLHALTDENRHGDQGLSLSSPGDYVPEMNKAKEKKNQLDSYDQRASSMIFIFH